MFLQLSSKLFIVNRMLIYHYYLSLIPPEPDD